MFEHPDVESVVVSVIQVETEALIDQRVHHFERPREIYTLDVLGNSYTLEMLGKDISGETVLSAEEFFLLSVGEDELWEPEGQTVQLALQISISDEIEPGETSALFVMAGHYDESGEPVWEEGIDITVDVIGGSAEESTGSTDIAGEFSTGVTFDEEATTLSIRAIGRLRR